MQSQHPLEAIHFWASAIVLIATFNKPDDPLEVICHLTILEKYGLCLALVIVVNGLRGLVRQLKVRRARHTNGIAAASEDALAG